MEKLSDPMLAHHARVLKLVRQSLYPQGLSDCCRAIVIDADDVEVCSCCLQHCTATPA